MHRRLHWPCLLVVVKVEGDVVVVVEAVSSVTFIRAEELASRACASCCSLFILRCERAPQPRSDRGQQRRVILL